MGYEGDLDVAMLSERREAIISKGELSRGILVDVRYAPARMQTQKIAHRELNGLRQNVAGCVLLLAQMRCVSKALNHLQASGVVTGADDENRNRLCRVA